MAVHLGWFLSGLSFRGMVLAPQCNFATIIAIRSPGLFVPILLSALGS